MSDIKEIRILPMSNSDVVSPTYDDAIDFSLNKLITQNNCCFYFKSKFNFIGKTLILFQYEGKLIGKGIFIDISEESNSEYSGYYLVDNDSIQVFNKNIYLNDLNEYVHVNKLY